MKYRTLLIMALLALLLPLAHAAAQTTTPPPPETGAFDKLSPGGQKIANAIFEAQIQPTTPTNGTGTTTGTTGVTNGTTPEPLTLDQIAQRKLDGQGWGVIFKDLKAQGLVTSKNLGQAVSAFHPHHHVNPGAATSANNRPFDDAGPSAGGSAKQNMGSSGPSSNSGPSNMGGGIGASRGGGNLGHGGGNAYGKTK